MRVRQPSRPITFATFGRPIVSEFNLWVGVNKAGYSVGEELPIMLLLFLLPAALAGHDWKGKLSPVLYLLGIALSFIYPWLATLVYVSVAGLWLIPDRRIERTMKHDA